MVWSSELERPNVPTFTIAGIVVVNRVAVAVSFDKNSFLTLSHLKLKTFGLPLVSNKEDLDEDLVNGGHNKDNLSNYFLYRKLFVSIIY